MARLIESGSVQTAPRRLISRTLITACVLSGLAIWQVVHVSNGSAPLVQLTANAKPGPTKLRSDGREPRRNAHQSTDPIAAYLARAKRGMSDQEVRWMIEDFRALGLMPTSGSIEESRAYRELLNRWYLTALTEALSLTPEQRRKVQTSLAVLLDQAMDQFKIGMASEQGTIYPELVIDPNFEATRWLRRPELAPWNLCRLTEAQSHLTMERWWRDRKKAAMKAESPFNQEPGWVSFMSIAMQDPASGNLIEYPPPSIFDSACSMHGTIRGGVMDISDAFPLTPDQKLADHRNDLAAQARLLQPAQLRIALLLNPVLSDTILQQLDQPRPQVSPAQDPE